MYFTFIWQIFLAFYSLLLVALWALLILRNDEEGSCILPFAHRLYGRVGSTRTSNPL